MGFLKNSIFLIILSIIFNQFVLHHVPFVAAKDVLIPGDEINSLSSNTSLVSANGNFTLGFFKIQYNDFQGKPYIDSTYFGIWYSNDPGTKLWVANRDTPMFGSGVLMIDDTGTLKVVNGSGTTFFSVSNDQIGSGNKTNTRAALDNSGNFRVYDEIANGNRTLWQSFDHPTDTLLPSMKIGYNLTTKQNWTLTSWLTDQSPAPGAFTMRLEQYQNSPQLLIYWRDELYWASGPWERDNGTFEKIARFQYKLSLISDSSGMYLYFQSTVSTSSMLQLSTDGRFIAGGNQSYLTPAFCNIGYNQVIYYLDQCAVTPLPYCRGRDDSFQLKSGNWINTLGNHNDNSSLTFIDCMEICRKDCNCAGFNTNSNGTGCLLWSNETPFQLDQTGQTQPKYVLVSIKPPKNKTWIWILVSVSSVLTFVLTSILCFMRIRKRRLEEKEKRMRDDYIQQLAGSNSFNYGDELERGIPGAPDIKIFSLGAILAATDNFSNENKLGQGGYGPVYKGKLFDGREIAIKRLSKTSGQGVEQFKSELILISKLQHTNLVRLYGCCIHQGEKMLIYEFMPNKSLDFFLFVEDKKKKIDWQMRFSIIEGVAQGMLYLHKYSRMKVIHRDLKVSNILLDGNMKPKIADFGMAKIFQPEVTEGITYRVVGTYGYMAPEYAMQGTFSIKSDVFSFGVLILEIVSGRKNSSFYNLDRPLNLVGYAWELWKKDAALELKDEALGESCNIKQLLISIHVGLLCVQENAYDRPTMSEVIFMLNNEIADLPIPKQPAFFTQSVEVRSPASTEHLLDNNIQVSNGLTFTTMEAR